LDQDNKLSDTIGKQVLKLLEEESTNKVEKTSRFVRNLIYSLKEK